MCVKSRVVHLPADKDGEPEGAWLSYHESRSECIWFRQHRIVVRRLLLFLSVVLAVLGLCMCCTSLSNGKKTNSREKVRERGREEWRREGGRDGERRQGEREGGMEEREREREGREGGERGLSTRVIMPTIMFY